jgi:hypothetical protein
MIAIAVSISMAGSNRTKANIISSIRATRPSVVAKCKEFASGIDESSSAAGFADDRSDPVATALADGLDPSSFMSRSRLISRP